MGNTPSKEPQSRPLHKLSKPRVASFQTPAPSTTSSSQPSRSGPKPSSEPVQAFLSIPYSATSSNSNADDTGDVADDQQGSDKSTPLVAPKAQRRLSLFRSKSSQEAPDRRKSRRNTIIGSPTVPSERDFSPVVRANSVSTHQITDLSHDGQRVKETWPVTASRASWAYDLSSYESQRLLTLVQDRPMPISRSQTSTPLSYTRVDDTPRRRASMFVQTQSAPISRSNSELSLHPPMRRRSLIQTPGVATRPHPGLRHSHPPTPSMSRQPSTHFEECDSDLLSLPPLDFPIDANGDKSRVATPKDEDYSITGAFKFGTLRITNGSPVLSPNLALSHASDFLQAKFEGKPEDCHARESQGEGGVRSGGDGEQAQPSVQSCAVSQTVDSVAVGTQKSSLEAVREETNPSLSISIPEWDLKGQCMSDLQSSPGKTVQPHPASPLMTQSKQAAVDDDLFEDDTEVSVPEVLDIRVDLNARSFPRQTVDSTQTSEGVKRSDSGFVSSSQSDSSQSRSSLAKADSGYSSNVSLRSLRHGRKLALSEEVAGNNSSDSDQGSQKIQRSGSQKVLGLQAQDSVIVDDDDDNNDEHAVGTLQSDQAPPPPPKDDFLMKQVRSPCGAQAAVASPTAPGRMHRKPVHQRPSAIDTSRQASESQELQSPKPLPPSPASATSDGSSSSLSIANSPQKPGRLQRLLSLRTSPLSKQPYTVHETHSVDSKVPSIPKEVEAKLRERTGLYPMTTKRLALKSQMSKETLKTILSVGSLECSNDDDLQPNHIFLDQDNGEDDKKLESGIVKEHSLRQTFSYMQSNLRTATASMIPGKKAVVRKPLPVREPQQRVDDHIGKEDMLPLEMELTSYSSVSSSLGSNAYDSAARTLPPTRLRRSMSMTTGQDNYLQLRTYSLNSRPSSVPLKTLSSSTAMPEDGHPLPRRKTSPPISMTTRTSFRTPPPRSLSRPQGPAVRQEESQNTVSRSASQPAAPALGRHSGHYGSVGDGQWGESAPASQVYVSTWDSPSRHSSLSSVRSNFVRGSRGSELHSQQPSGATLKHQSSLEGVGRHQPYGVYVPQSAHRMPTLGPQTQSENTRGHRNPQRGRPMSGQLPWGAPPYVPRGHHRRNLSAGSHPSNYAYSDGGHAPYRILHSYNSPAYRNAPIWG